MRKRSDNLSLLFLKNLHENIQAVSYTHLDVYKRQQGNWVEQRSSRTEQVAESYLGYTEATDAFGVQQEETDGFATEVSYRCLLYTSVRRLN